MPIALLARNFSVSGVPQHPRGNLADCRKLAYPVLIITQFAKMAQRLSNYNEGNTDSDPDEGKRGDYRDNPRHLSQFIPHGAPHRCALQQYPPW